MSRNDMKPSSGGLLYAVAGILLVLLAVALFYNRAAEEGNFYKLKIAGKEITVELARTTQEHGLGLMYRHSLPENHGMLFIFPEEEHLSFWMKNTYIPLSIAFISTEGIITQIEPMEPLSVNSHDSKEKVRYALEMLEGWFERHNVKVGDRMELPPEAVRSRQ